jgi:anti-sigma regulatory factor (Ser/Thr protein kinase)
VLEDRGREGELRGNSFASQLAAKEKEILDLRNAVAELKTNKITFYSEYKSTQEKRCSRGVVEKLLFLQRTEKTIWGMV